jgi:hypothetical protein
MRKLLLIGLVLVLMVGCKKRTTVQTTNPSPQPPPQPAPVVNNQPQVHAPTGVVINPGPVGGGAGGAAQAVRGAAKRTVGLVEMDQLRLFIDTASSATGQMPTPQEITTALQREAPQIHKLIQDKAIILTGTRSRENIWAYTADPQAGRQYHVVITGSGVDDKVDAQTLRQRLQQQRGQ